jgi:xanthine dehydrogenase YagS FAD-binding subunit
MKRFKHYDAHSLKEAVSILEEYDGKAEIIAGGTDIIGKYKDSIRDDLPEALVNIKTIEDLNYIKEEDGFLKIGSLTLLHDIYENEIVREKYGALAGAARRTASPHIREMGTIGGNICQDCRCWYYRTPENRFDCVRKGKEEEGEEEKECYAEEGENRYHSIFGDVKDCLAVHPSDTAPALIVLDAKIKTTKRVLDIKDLYQDEEPEFFTVLDNDEIVEEIQIPEPPQNAKSEFIKFSIRESIDFPIVNCAALVVKEKDKVKKANICLNAVYAKPVIAEKGMEFLEGKKLDLKNAKEAAEISLEGAEALDHNEYKIQAAKGLIKKTLLKCK